VSTILFLAQQASAIKPYRKAIIENARRLRRHYVPERPPRRMLVLASSVPGALDEWHSRAVIGSRY